MAWTVTELNARPRNFKPERGARAVGVERPLGHLRQACLDIRQRAYRIPIQPDPR